MEKRYSGNVTILNESGDIIHDRDLSSDEIIDELLREPEEEEEEVVATPPKSQKKKNSPPKGGGRSTRVPCSECGSIGARHFKTCSKFGAGNKNTPPPSPEPEKEGEREIDKVDDALTPEQFANIRADVDAGDSWALIYLNYPDLPTAELRRAKEFQEYDAYKADYDHWNKE